MKPTIQQQVAAYERVIDLTQRGVIDPYAQRNLDQCMYAFRTGGKTVHCGVGALFTPAQIADLKKRDLNADTGIDRLADEIGVDNVVAATGLPMTSLRTLQNTHDELSGKCEYDRMTREDAQRKLISYCKGRIRRITA